jgi:ankyrin repeat protein
MSRTAKITGCLLVAIIGAMVIAGWRIYDHAAHDHVPQSLGEQLIDALDRRSLTRASQLLDAGADVRSREQFGGRTCLMAAAMHPDPIFIQRLIERGADVNATDFSGSTPLDYLLSGGHATSAMAKMLMPAVSHLQRNRNTGSSSLVLAAQAHDPAVIAVLLNAGASPNDKDMGGKPLLIVAAEADDLPVVKQLVAHGASANTRGPMAELPLSIALKLGDDAMGQYLIAHGADRDAVDTDGNPVLVSAVANNAPGSFRALLSRGAKIDARNKGGETALIVAAHEGRREMVDALLKYRADSTLHDKTTRTALAWATELGFADVVRTLRQGGVVR